MKGKKVKHNYSYYDSKNNKPPIVIIHGLSLRVGYTNLIKELETDFRVIVPDLPFAFESSKSVRHTVEGYSEYLYGLLLNLDITKAYVYGNSLGGALAINIAYKYPNCFQGMVIRSPFISRKTIKPQILKWPTLSFIQLVAKNDYIIKTFISRIFFEIMARMSVNRNTDMRIYSQIIEEQKKINIYDARDFLLDLINTDLSAQIEQLNIPIIVIWASKDKLLDIKELERLKNRVKGASIVIDNNSQHCIVTVNSKELGDLIKRVLNDSSNKDY